MLDLRVYFNFPELRPAGQWWQDLAAKTQEHPSGRQHPWGIPFEMGEGTGPRAICVTKDRPEITVEISARADYLCLLHQWYQQPADVQADDPTEGLVVAQYELTYTDSSSHVQPVRARFEVNMIESPGPAWCAAPFHMYEALDPVHHRQDLSRAEMHRGIRNSHGDPLLFTMPNPHPEKQIATLTIRGLHNSPLLVSGLTLYQGSGDPLKHLPRCTYQIESGAGPAMISKARVDLGGIARVQRTSGARGEEWLGSPYVGLTENEPPNGGEDLLEVFGAPDAAVSVTLENTKPLRFSLGRAFHEGASSSGRATLKVLGKQRQWMRVRVIDSATGKPTPARVHFSGSHGQYLAPYGHHEEINTNWFEDYGADVSVGGRNFAYISGEFATELPVGDVYVELCKGFEYKPVRKKVTVEAGQEVIDLEIERWKDLRREGWVTADTHVHFISPHTAWLEAQAEGVNVVNLLASQWGRMFSNIGDLTGRVGISESDTIVYVGTENRNHMLGHISMLGTQGLPVYPMCCGMPHEGWVGDPEFLTLAECAMENRRKGGLVIRPHFPYSGHTEDPVLIIKQLVDALEIRPNEFSYQEWYRYLNCGYRVAVVGGTDKMNALTAVGSTRTYAHIDSSEPLTYDNWAAAVRSGRTYTTNGPLLDLHVEGVGMGEEIRLPAGGGTVEVNATAECYSPLGGLEIVCNGVKVAEDYARNGSNRLSVSHKINMPASGWVAARCTGLASHPGAYLAAHSSPVYVKCGESGMFDGPAMEHMLALVEGGAAYLNKLAAVFDEKSKTRMISIFSEASRELKQRLIANGYHIHPHRDGLYHTHGHGV